MAANSPSSATKTADALALCYEFGTNSRFAEALPGFLVSLQFSGSTDSLSPEGLAPPSKGARLYSQPFTLPPFPCPALTGAITSLDVLFCSEIVNSLKELLNLKKSVVRV